MVSTENYTRLKALINSAVKPEGAEDTQEQTMSTNIRDGVDAVKALSDALIQDTSVGQSQTKLGADEWMNTFSTDTSARMELIKVTKERHEKLRAEMSELYGDGEKLSDLLINGEDIRAARSGTVTVVTNPFQRTAFEAEAALYLAQLAEQRNQKREEEAKRILDRLNAAGQDHATNIHEPVDKPDPVPDPDPQPEPRRPHKPWRPSNGGGGGATIPSVTGGGHSSPTGPDSGGHSWIRPSGDEPGSITHPISDPKDMPDIDLTRTLVNARMTPNGPVGGHMPADVLNIDDPAWRAAPLSSGGAARIAGGTLVAGSAAGAAGGLLARGGGYGGIAGMTPGAALRPTAPAGGVLRPSSMPGGAAGVVGRGGVGGAGMRSGMAPVGSSGSGAGSRGGAGVVGRGGAGAAGRSGAGAGAAGRGGVAGRGGGGAGVVGRGGSSAGAAPSRGGASGAAGRGGAGASRGGAGVVGRGGAGASRGGAGVVGRGGASGVAGRSGAAASRGGAGVVGRGGASGVAGCGGASGVAGRGGAAASRGGAGVAGRGGASGAAGRGGAGGRGVLGGGSSAGRGEKKKETQRRNYDVVRVDGIEEQSMGVVGGAAGSADQLKPLSRDSGEDW